MLTCFTSVTGRVRDSRVRTYSSEQFAIKGFQYEILFVELTVRERVHSRRSTQSGYRVLRYHGIPFSHVHAAVNIQSMAGDVRRSVARKKTDRGGHVLGSAHSFERN